MRIMNKGGTSQGLAVPSAIAHPISKSSNPRYMGLRLNRKTPAVTRYEVFPGFKGSNVVRASRKALPAAPVITRPITIGSNPR
jgi:hypothetical protein